MTPAEAQELRMQLIDQGDFVTFTVRKSDVPVIKAVIGMLTDIYLADAQGIVTGTDETQSGSVERSEIEPGPKDAPNDSALDISKSGTRETKETR